MCAGEVRSGIAYAALRRPGPPSMVASAGDPGLGEGGVVLHGHAPWVTGWGLIDTVYVGARDGDDLVWALLDAVAGPTVQVQPVRLAAVDASSTVVLGLDGHRVSEARGGGPGTAQVWPPTATWRSASPPAAAACSAPMPSMPTSPPCGSACPNRRGPRM
jgi:alkylation response protein AidB-like acyl-CoA dehydrogenase